MKQRREIMSDSVCVQAHVCVRKRQRNKASHPNDKLIYEQRPEGGEEYKSGTQWDVC